MTAWRDAPRDRERKAILRKAAACSDKGPHAALPGIAGGRLLYDRVRVGAKNPVRQWVRKNGTAFNGR